MRDRGGLSLALLAVLTACGGTPPAPGASPTASTAAAAPAAAPSGAVRDSGGALAAGQTWRYRTRPGETGSVLRILRIEDRPAFGRVVHVTLTGVRIRRRNDPSRRWDSLPDLKFSEAAIKESVTALVGEDPPGSAPAAGASGVETSRGQVFLIPVNQVLDLIERGLEP